LQSCILRSATVARERKSTGFCFLVAGDQKHQEKQVGSPMITKATFALLAATAAAGLVSPAFAQTFDRYGSSLPYYYDSSGAQVWGSWGPKEQGSSPSKVSTSRAQSVTHHRGYSAYAHVRPR
jgi:hypothetical protein